MSWNLFGRVSAPKKSVITRSAEREFEREVKKLEELDESTRKVYKDIKRCQDANIVLSKSEHKVVQDLLASSICHSDEEFRLLLETWNQGLTKLDSLVQELNANSQKTVIDPMKKFSSIFPGVQAAIKKREQNLQELMKCQAKLEKYQDRDRTGQNVVKYDLSKKLLTTAKEEFDNHNSNLLEDMPKLYDGRLDYFQPCLEALIKTQVTYDSESLKVYSDTASHLNGVPDINEEEYNTRIQQKLADIKALSITVD